MSVPDIATVPARDGYDWIRLSLRLFRMQWLRYCAIAALFILLLQIAAALTGGLLAFFLKPILSVGFLAATWHHERGETPEVKHLFAGFRSNIGALLPLGLFYLLGLLAAATLAVYVSGLDLRLLMEAQTTGDMQKIDRDALGQFMMTTVVAMLPVNAALWFAPALIVFSDAGPFQALRVSFFAWTRNIFAVVAYAIAFFALLCAGMLLVVPLIIVGGGALQNLIAMIALVPLTAIYMISDYVSYRRVFHRSERLQANQPN
jgi:MFS family permease